VRREGSPWTGLWAVVAKEMADHLTGARMRLLEVLIFLSAGGAVYLAIQKMPRSGDDPFLFLKLFTTAQEPLPAFVGFLGFFIPLVAIALGFDAINGEHGRRTLSRVLAQPIYRDALLLGKFLAGIFTLAIVLTTIWLLVMGLGILRLGIPPSTEAVARSLIFILATLAYGGIWLGLSMAFSVVFRQPATAALAAIAVWLFFIVFWGMIASFLAQALYPDRPVSQVQFELNLARLSPNTLYSEIIFVLLNPEVRALGLISSIQLYGAILGTPLPLSQSLLLVWPQFTGLVALVIILFALGYVLFQRQEIRA